MQGTLRYLFPLFLLLLGCQNAAEKTSQVIFAGEIVNPTSDYIVLFKDDTAIDSVKLDDANRFSFAFDTISNGLYHFVHAPELQYVYLQAGDSLVIRLNTVDFDESLVFSGTGEDINNFLLELFLASEQETPLVASLYRLDPEAFQSKIDSLKIEKLEQLKAIGTESELSNEAINIAKASITYHYNAFKERYPFEHRRRTGQVVVNQLPDGFYAYRQNINFNDSRLSYLKPYYDFMGDHFNNLSYMSCKGLCDAEREKVHNRLHFNKHKLRLIDSLAEEQRLRDNLFRNVAYEYLLKTHDEKETAVFMTEFEERYGNNRHMEEIERLYRGIQNLQPHKQIPDIQIHNFDDREVSLKTLVESNKNVVLYFWTGTRKRHYNDIIRQVEMLAQKYPDYTYIGINFNTENDRWKALVREKNLDEGLQYRAENFQDLTAALIIYPLNKGIVIKDGLIADAFANMYSPTSF